MARQERQRIADPGEGQTTVQPVGPAPDARSRMRSLPGARRSDSPLELDRVIHERLRLGLVSALAASPTLTFVELKRLLDTTDGNLSVHARKLEDAGYITVSKSFDGRSPRTEFRLTHAGRKAFERYLDHMDAIIKAARSATGGDAR
jgi:DNA-binding MarR family transcriptional regulator